MKRGSAATEKGSQVNPKNSYMIEYNLCAGTDAAIDRATMHESYVNARTTGALLTLSFSGK